MKRKAAYYILSLPLIVAVAACGKVGDLEPATGQGKVPVAYGAKKSQTAEELFTPSEQARPGRSDELMRRSERREVDPFDLPPGATTVPLPDQAKEDDDNSVDTNTDPKRK